MDPGLQPSGAIQPLSMGNVINAGLSLYRTHFKQYLQVSLKATGWLILPFLLTFLVGIFYAIVQDYWQFLGLLIPAVTVLFVYCIAQYLAASASISRLAFGEMINRPESIQSASRYTRARMWGFCLVGFLLGLMFFGIVMSMYILFAIVLVVALGASGGFAFLSSSGGSAPPIDPVAIIGLIFLFLIVLVLVVTLITWLSARFAIAELPLAIEAEISPTQSIGRCLKLTDRNAWRIVGVLFVTVLITFPVQLVVQLLSSISQLILSIVLPPDSALYQAVSVGVAYLIGLASSVFLLPLWQSIKSAIYYDLRSRREGLGLELRDSI